MATTHDRERTLTRTTDAVLEAVLKRDRIIICVGIAVTLIASWLYVGALAIDMQRTPLGHMMGEVLAPQPATWTFADAWFAQVMWSVMMVGMMLPSSSRVILLYAYLGRRAAPDEPPFAATTWFVLGYFFAWIVFSALATFLQCVLDSAALLTPMMESGSEVLSGVILLACGLYQLSPLKAACLARTQAPLGYIESQGGFRRDARGAVLLGLRHGVNYVGCCWALMLLMFVSGVMNVLWGALLTLYVLVEALDSRQVLSRAAGIALTASGVILLYYAVYGPLF